MGKFKVGDRVRALESDSSKGYKTGDAFDVTGTGRSGRSVEFTDNDGDGRTRPEAEFELVPAAPAAGKFKVGDRVRTVEGSTRVDIVGHWNDHFRSYAGEIVDGALVVASISECTIGLSNKVGKAHFYMPPHTLTHATLTIREGRFYKTRDGRKVGPMRRATYHGPEWKWIVAHQFDAGIGIAWRADGTFGLDRSKEHDADLIAEWVDEPAASNDNAPAAEQLVAKFKVGDVVVSKVTTVDVTAGKRYTVTRVDETFKDVYFEDDAGDLWWLSFDDVEIADQARDDAGHEIVEGLTVTLTADTSEFEASLDRCIAKLERLRELSADLSA